MMHLDLHKNSLQFLCGGDLPVCIYIKDLSCRGAVELSKILGIFSEIKWKNIGIKLVNCFTDKLHKYLDKC
jgi:hypothetical protein